MVLAYAVYVMLLALSPILGRFFLRFVYPDIRTFVQGKKVALYTAFGLAAYVPAAIISLFEFIIPLYSPLSSTPLIFDYEGNAIATVLLFIGILVMNSSIVDFAVVRRKKTLVVGIPTKVIQYGIRQEIVKGKKQKRERDLERITGSLQEIAEDKEDISALIEKIRHSVSKERSGVGEAIKIKDSPAFKELNLRESKLSGENEKEQSKPVIKSGSVIPKDGLTKEKLAPLMQSDIAKEIKKAAEEGPQVKPAEKGGSETSEKAGHGFVRTSPEPMKGASSGKESSNDTLNELKHVLEEGKEKEVMPEEPGPSKEVQDKKEEGNGDKEVLLTQLESRLKKASEDVKMREKIDSLLGELRESIDEDYGAIGDTVGDSSDVEEITRSLRELREGKEDKEKEGRIGHEDKEDVEESLVTYVKAYPSQRNDDVLKSVVGDVRQQLSEKESAGEEESDSGKRWYERAPEATNNKIDSDDSLVGSGVELFEDDISLGDGNEFGDLGEGFDDMSLGGLGDLEQGLNSEGFDGMFVDMGKRKEGCPNCGKKGTSIVYCSNCGKPLCSNCAVSVDGSESYVKYGCPHCKSEFAMKKRMPSE
jgi:hypothetical protein